MQAVSLSRRALRIEAPSIVGDGYRQRRRVELQRDADFCRRRMRNRVLERLARGQDQVVPLLGAQFQRGQDCGDVENAVNACQRQMLAGKLAEVIGKAFQRIMLGVDGPDDFIQ